MKDTNTAASRIRLRSSSNNSWRRRTPTQSPVRHDERTRKHLREFSSHFQSEVITQTRRKNVINA